MLPGKGDGGMEMWEQLGVMYRMIKISVSYVSGTSTAANCCKLARFIGVFMLTGSQIFVIKADDEQYGCCIKLSCLIN